MVVLRANPLRRDLTWSVVLRRTYSPAPTAANDRASPFRRSGSARFLWEDDLKRFDDQLNPSVLFNRQQRNNFRACSDDDRNGSKCGGIHVFRALPLAY